MACSDCDGQRIDPCFFNKFDALARVGEVLFDIVNADDVLLYTAQLAQFRFDHNAVVVSILNYLLSSLYVLLER